MLRPSFLSRSTADLSDTDFLSAAGWVYLALGFVSGLTVLFTSGISLTAGSGLYFNESTIGWAVAILVLSVVGSVLIRNVRSIQGRVEERIRKAETLG